MSRFFVFLILLSAELRRSDCATLPRGIENGETTREEGVLTERSFENLKNKLLEKFLAKVSAQSTNGRPATEAVNSTMSDSRFQTILDAAKNLLTRQSDDQSATLQSDYKFLDELWDRLFELFQRPEIAHDPVDEDVEIPSKNSCESDPSPGRNQICVK